jgi:hypothetical protein
METSRAARVTAAAAASAAAAAPPLPPSPARPDPLPAALARLTSPDCEAVPVRRAPIKGPSGPRRQGEGVEEEEQAVLSADKLANGGLQLRVTLLAAGFVIGASGSSVREIAAATGAVVQSWSEPSAPGLPRPTRVFRVPGQPRAAEARAILQAAQAAAGRASATCAARRRRAWAIAARGWTKLIAPCCRRSAKGQRQRRRAESESESAAVRPWSCDAFFSVRTWGRAPLPSGAMSQ